MPSRAALSLPVVAIAAIAGMAWAQIEGGSRGVAPVASAGVFEVSGVQVDVAAANAEAARTGAWKLAQRRAWAQLTQRLGRAGTKAGDGLLDQLATGIVVENEQIGPKRYIARLGVLFDRGRTASVLNIPAYAERSPPMLVIPIQFTGGVGEAFESRTPWHEAWARFRTGNSSVDYIRPAGNGVEPLLLNVGQTGRPGRGWWRTIIDQYGAADVLIPTVRLQRQWPGGPVVAQFQARYGPDNRLLGSFVLRVENSDGLPRLMDAGVARLDQLYQRGFRTGVIRPDASLRPPPAPEPVLDEAPGEDTLADIIGSIVPSSGAGISISVQFETPTASAVANTEQIVRNIPGVQSAQTASVALAGVSVMRVTFDGDPATFASALEARGWQVIGQGQAIRIRRAPQLPPPDLSEDNPG